jgi:hypothetical protein
MINPIIDINYILEKLKKRRKVFHSEAYFQFELAWTIKEVYNERASIRLEYYTIDKSEINQYIDIVVFIDDKHFIPIELKYKTKSSENPIVDNNEIYNLKSQGAQDLGKFDYLHDIERVESYKDLFGFTEGYCILLTNDESYTKVRDHDTRNKEFNIGHNQTKQGVMSWRNDSSIYTKEHRKKSIILKESYKMKWDTYHDFSNGKNSKFFILVTTIY